MPALNLWAQKNERKEFQSTFLKDPPKPRPHIMEVFEHKLVILALTYNFMRTPEGMEKFFNLEEYQFLVARNSFPATRTIFLMARGSAGGQKWISGRQKLTRLSLSSDQK